MALSGAELLEQLRPALNQVEQDRLKHLADFTKQQPLCFFAWAIVAVLTIVAFVFMPDPIVAIFGIVGGGGVWYWYSTPARRFRAGYKRELLPRIAEQFGDFTYSLTGGIHLARMKPSRILPPSDRYKREDHFAGNFEGVRIEFNEAILQQRRRSGKRTHYVTVFKGLFVLLDMNKNFEGHTIVRKDAGVLNFFGSFGSLERIKLEDPDFERQYEVYGSDQVESRYLLTPAFMERLKKLNDSVGAQGMECAFYQNRLLVLMKHNKAMSSDGLLEPGSLKEPVHQADSIAKIADEFAAICGIVHELKLHERTGI